MKIYDVMRDENGRLLIIRGGYEDQKLLIVNIYGPNRDDREFFSDIFKRIELMGVERKIIGGDLTQYSIMRLIDQ